MTELEDVAELEDVWTLLEDDFADELLTDELLTDELLTAELLETLLDDFAELDDLESLDSVDELVELSLELRMMF